MSLAAETMQSEYVLIYFIYLSDLLIESVHGRTVRLNCKTWRKKKKKMPCTISFAKFFLSSVFNNSSTWNCSNWRSDKWHKGMIWWLDRIIVQHKKHSSESVPSCFMQENRVCISPTSLQSLPELLCGLGTEDSKLHQAKRDTSVYEMLQSALTYPPPNFNSTISLFH